jgi:hypothetical protein
LEKGTRLRVLAANNEPGDAWFEAQVPLTDPPLVLRVQAEESISTFQEA